MAKNAFSGKNLITNIIRSNFKVPDVHRRLAHLGHRGRVRREGGQRVDMDKQKVRARPQCRPHCGRQSDHGRQDTAQARHDAAIRLRGRLEAVENQLRGQIREIFGSRLFSTSC